MDILALALEGTETRNNVSRPFHIEIHFMGRNSPMVGKLSDIQPTHIVIEEFELSRNGKYVAVKAPPLFILREIITASRILYTDGEC